MSAPSGPPRFFEDLDNLQRINIIQNSSVGSKIKHVIELLRDRNQSLNADEINVGCHVDLKSDMAVFNNLKNNPVVKYNGFRFSYKSESSNVDEGFTVDPKIPSIEVDDDLKYMYRAIILPRDMVEIENYLRSNGIKAWASIGPD